MTILTIEQLEFLDSNQITLDMVFDAAGLSQRQYKEIMSRSRQLIAIGVAPCRKYGHTMRTRAGHCVQCGPHNLAFLRRYQTDGYLYLAYSYEIECCKIGTTNDADQRISTLNETGYASISDWILIEAWHTNDMGRIELNAHRILNDYKVSFTYFRHGQFVESTETFNCSLDLAMDACLEAIRDDV